MGWIITAAIAVLVAVLLFTPISIRAHYDGETTRMWLRVLILRFKIFDSSKPKKEKKQKNKTTTKKKQPKKSFFEMLHLVCDLARSGLKAGKIVKKHLRFYGVRVFWKIAREDPYETGLAFGRTNAVAYPVFGALANLFNVKFERLEIVPDFTSQNDVCDITLKAKMSPFNIIRAGIVFLFDFAKRTALASADNNKTLTNTKNIKEGALNNG